MRRPGERADGSADDSLRLRLRGGDHTSGEGGGVGGRVVGLEHQQRVHHTLVQLGRLRAGQHAQRHVRHGLAGARAIVRSARSGLRDDTDEVANLRGEGDTAVCGGLKVTLVEVVDLRRERGHSRLQREHRVGNRRQVAGDLDLRRRQRAARFNLRDDRRRACSVREFAVVEQRDHFFEAGTQRQLFDRVAAVVQPSAVAIHE